MIRTSRRKRATPLSCLSGSETSTVMPVRPRSTVLIATPRCGAFAAASRILGPVRPAHGSGPYESGDPEPSGDRLQVHRPSPAPGAASGVLLRLADVFAGQS